MLSWKKQTLDFKIKIFEEKINLWGMGFTRISNYIRSVMLGGGWIWIWVQTPATSGLYKPEIHPYNKFVPQTRSSILFFFAGFNSTQRFE